MHSVQHRSPGRPATPRRAQLRDAQPRGPPGPESRQPTTLTLWRLLLITCCCILVATAAMGAAFARDFTLTGRGRGVSQARVVTGQQRRSQLEGEGQAEQDRQVRQEAGARRQRVRPRLHQGIATAHVGDGHVRTWPRNGKGIFKQQPERHHSPATPLQPSDFVVAIASQHSNQGMLTAGRAARKGMLTYVATNYEPSHNRSYPTEGYESHERWGYFPDDKMVRSFYRGDTRAAVVPFMAYKELGDTFKWLFYSDDDTVLFIDAAIRLAQGLDHNMPYFLTDNLWYSEHWEGARHPHVDAVRCLPCGYDMANFRMIMNEMTPGCPCTPAVVCGLDDGYLQVINNESCGVPRTPVRTYAVHGGAGVLISVGLFRNVDYRSFVRTVKASWNSGGDAFFTTALWQAGFVATDPGPTWHPEFPLMTRFDPRGLPIFHPDEDILPKSAYVLSNMLQKAAGTCRPGSLCQLEYESFVSLHLRARRMGGSRFVAAALIRAFSRFCVTHLRSSPADDAAVNDSATAYEVALAERIDARFAAAVEGTKQLGELLQMSATENSEGEIVLEIPIRFMRERAESSAISAVARHVLRLAIEDAAAVERVLLASAKLKMRQIEEAEEAAGEGTSSEANAEKVEDGRQDDAGTDKKAEV